MTPAERRAAHRGDLRRAAAFCVVAVALTAAGLFALCSCSSSMTTAIDGGVRVVNAAATFLDGAEQAIASLERAAQHLAVDRATSRTEAEASLARVDTDFARVWSAYRVAREAEIVAMNAVRGAEGAKAADMEAVAAAVQRLLSAEADLVAAVKEVSK